MEPCFTNQERASLLSFHLMSCTYAHACERILPLNMLSCFRGFPLIPENWQSLETPWKVHQKRCFLSLHGLLLILRNWGRRMTATSWLHLGHIVCSLQSFLMLVQSMSFLIFFLHNQKVFLDRRYKSSNFFPIYHHQDFEIIIIILNYCILLHAHSVFWSYLIPISL